MSLECSYHYKKWQPAYAGQLCRHNARYNVRYMPDTMCNPSPPYEHMPAINVQHYVHHYVKIYDNISRAFLVYADLNQVDHFQLI